RGLIIAAAHVVAGGGDARLEGDVTEIFEVDEAVRGVEAEDFGDGHAGGGEVALHINEGQLGGLRALDDLVRLGGVVAELHDDQRRARAAGGVDAVVAAQRRAAGQGDESAGGAAQLAHDRGGGPRQPSRGEGGQG